MNLNKRTTATNFISEVRRKQIYHSNRGVLDCGLLFVKKHINEECFTISRFKYSTANIQLFVKCTQERMFRTYPLENKQNVLFSVIHVV